MEEITITKKDFERLLSGYAWYAGYWADDSDEEFADKMRALLGEEG